MEENATKTQAMLIRAWLERGNSISPLEALRDFGCLRLGARISDLRRDGLRISTTMEKGISRATGRTVHYARYKLNMPAEG